MSAFFDWLTSSAVSLTVSGNTGISPFLTLFLIGIIEISDPTILNMDGTIESILSSWYSIAILGILTLLEFIGKCVPVIDEAIDSVEVFIVPVLSILGSLGTFGLLNLLQEEGEEITDDIDEGGRELSSVGDSFLLALKIILAVVGVGLALAIHLFKMLIRFTGLLCCGGCCQPCITVVEVSCVLSGVLFAVFVRQIAIVTAILLFLAAGYAISKKFFNKEGENQQRPNSNTPNSATQTTTTTTTTVVTTTTPGNANNGGNQPAPSPQNKTDEENPPSVAPSGSVVVLPAPVVEPSAPVELSEMTPLPPPAMNPNYEAPPVAVAEKVE